MHIVFSRLHLDYHCVSMYGMYTRLLSIWNTVFDLYKWQVYIPIRSNSLYVMHTRNHFECRRILVHWLCCWYIHCNHRIHSMSTMSIGNIHISYRLYYMYSLSSQYICWDIRGIHLYCM